MDLPRNRFAAALRRGETLYGLWLGLPDTSAAEICALAGFDWLVIDAEHAPFDVPAILRHLQTLEPYDVAPVVRVVDDNPALLKQVLDVGAQTLLVPMVDSAEQAARIAASVRYPPEGTRGIGTSLARAARWSGIAGYLANANREICLLVQAETTTALANLDAILAVEGIHGVFIGPSDLAASMGHIGNSAHPDVVAAIETALRRINAAGKAAGVLVVDAALRARYRSAGACFFGVGVDTQLLGAAVSALARECRGE